jgi:hypothetical protein
MLLAAGPAAADRVRVAVAPIDLLTEGHAEVGALEQTLADAVAALPDHEVVPPAAVRQELRQRHRRELESCEGDSRCLAELGRAVQVGLVVGAEAGALAEGAVLYLKAVAADGHVVGTTTLVVDSRAPAAATAADARAAACRLLAPRDYVGTLVLHADVSGATVYLDGRSVGTVPVAPLAVPVGTHALRVTHPLYRDFVRFVEVRYGERTDLTVGLSEFPIVSEGLRAEHTAPRRFYESPWLIAGAGVALAAVTAIVVVVAFRPEPGRDRDVTVSAPR